MTMKNRIPNVMTAALVLALGACSGEVPSSRAAGDPGGDDLGGLDGTPETAPEPEADEAAAGPLNTFHHPAALGGAATDLREALRRMESEGPPLYAARAHTCRKMRYS